MIQKTLNFSLCRPNAVADQAENGALRVKIVSCVEHLAPGRVPSLNVRTDLPLKAGVIYKGYTGVVPGSPCPFLACIVRADDEAWKFGVEVRRLGVSPQGELIVYFSVLEPVQLDRVEIGFEVSHPALDGMQFFATNGDVLATPGIKLAIEPASARRVVERPGASAAQVPDADAERKARDWLNSPDDKGRVVSGTDQAQRPMPPLTATVAPAAAPKEMSNPLSKGVVRDVLRPAAGDKILEPSFKEETVDLQPTTERPAEPQADPGAALTSV